MNYYYEKVYIPMNIWINGKDKESFYSELNKEGITDEDYAHAQKVWDALNIKTGVSIMTYMFNLILHCLQMYLKALEING